MEPICEAKFHERNNGFRPYRSTQNAIAQCYKMAQLQNLHFVVDVDIVGFFDNIDHSKLIRQLWGIGIQDRKLIMIIKQIYPFGQMGFGYNDNMHQVVPMYSLIWDVLHGRASSVYSLQMGMGTDLSAMKSVFSMSSPFNLLLYLVPRSHILGFIPVMTIIKMACMSVAMYFFLNHDKRFSGTPYSFKALFSIMYSFSGYVLLYASCFSPWMLSLIHI